MKFLLLNTLAALSAAALSAAEKPILRAGAAAVDITPKVFPLNMPPRIISASSRA